MSTRTHTGVGDRLKFIRDRLRLSQEALGRRLGTSQATIARWEKGKNAPAAEEIAGLAGMGVDIGWLITGQGVAPADFETLPPNPNPPPTHDVSTVHIPLLAPRLGAGDGDDGDDKIAGHFSLDRSVVSRLSVAEKHLRAAMVRGDSMEPWLHDGDVVLFDRDPSARDAVCVVSVRGAVLVKRIQDVDGDRLRVLSDNPAYPPREVGPEDDVRVIGRVVWRGQMGAR